MHGKMVMLLPARDWSGWRNHPKALHEGSIVAWPNGLSRWRSRINPVDIEEARERRGKGRKAIRSGPEFLT
ncbi:hypothetical protein PCS_01079 [Desulfocurvibacter africanus PCS]|uniref:Uncharacterized protein n=1 Tax=Desulfocurvibacter africanus PCS TaxID=1262666 RepID=M5PUV3_DESAF|nr:hypothetical protein PCS_01079 [Desulfocurvibacter africanus PCS]